MTIETLDLQGAGWVLQTGFDWEPEWAVAEDPRELGNVTSTAISERCRRKWPNLVYLTNSESARGYVEDFFRRNVGIAARFYFQFPEHVAAPGVAPALTAISGGAQAQRSITVRYSWKNSSGQTTASPTGTLVVPASYLVRVTLPVYPPSVAQATIYAAEDDPGNEQEQTVLSLTRVWTQPNAALLELTSSVPSANSAVESPTCKLSSSPRITRGVGRSWTLALSLEEVYS